MKMKRYFKNEIVSYINNSIIINLKEYENLLQEIRGECCIQNTSVLH